MFSSTFTFCLEYSTQIDKLVKLVILVEKQTKKNTLLSKKKEETSQNFIFLAKSTAYVTRKI